MMMEMVIKEVHQPDVVYIWLVDFFDNHFHCTIFYEELATLLDITASIIQR